jgi:hypothetical protein
MKAFFKAMKAMKDASVAYVVEKYDLRCCCVQKKLMRYAT